MEGKSLLEEALWRELPGLIAQAEDGELISVVIVRALQAGAKCYAVELAAQLVSQHPDLQVHVPLELIDPADPP